MSQPKLITKPFASDALPGYVNEIPKENPVGAPEQNASWSEGFPPITMTDIDDGGLPPNGEDMNGVLRAITEHNLFIGGGGVYEFTDDYITEVGGYSKGAVLISDDRTALWMSIQDNNTQNFNGSTKTQWRRIAFTDLDSTLASIQNALNTKADKSVTITAGDGLTGGGTLAGNRALAVDSSVVRTDRTITAGTGLSGGGNLSANRTLSVNYGTTAGTAAQGNDVRITGAAQKSANLSDLSSASTARQNLGLGSAATRDVGESRGNVMEVGAFGLGATENLPSLTDAHAAPATGVYRLYNSDNQPEGAQTNTLLNVVAARAGTERFASLFAMDARHSPNTFYGKTKNGADEWEPWVTFLTTGNIQSTTGQSTQYPMTQRAVTDALNTKANASTQVIAGTGLSGGGNLSTNRTLSVNYGTTAGTAAQGNDSRITGAVQSAGTGLTKTGTSLAVKYGTAAGTAAQGNDSRIVNSVQTSGNQTIAGTKTFSSFPVTPSAAPTANYQVANKKYVDDNAIGVGQTWQNVTGSRVAGTTYTNTTGKPIMVSVRSNVDDGYSQITVGGIVVAASGSTQGQGNDRHTVCAIVPNDVSYSYSGSAIALWAELR